MELPLVLLYKYNPPKIKKRNCKLQFGFVFTVKTLKLKLKMRALKFCTAKLPIIGEKLKFNLEKYKLDSRNVTNNV